MLLRSSSNKTASLASGLCCSVKAPWFHGTSVISSNAIFFSASAILTFQAKGLGVALMSFNLETYFRFQ